MTIFKRRIIAVIFAAIAIAASAFMIYDLEYNPPKYCEAGVYDMLTPELVEMYETEIAGEKILSDKSESRLKRTAERLNISVGKLKAIMLMQDLAGRTGRNVSLSELAQMNDVKLLALLKECGEKYLSAQTPQRRAELEKMLKGAIGIK